jgi:hypothetical protein
MSKRKFGGPLPIPLVRAGKLTLYHSSFIIEKSGLADRAMSTGHAGCARLAVRVSPAAREMVCPFALYASDA